MGCRQGFMHIDVDRIKTHIPRSNSTGNGVKIGTIIVEQSSGSMDDLGNLDDLLLKHPQCGGIGQHQPRRFGTDRRLQLL